MSHLDEKVAIVSGAAQGLGTAFAHKLSAEGATVVAFNVQESIAAVAETIQGETGNTVLGLVADVSQPGDVQSVVNTTTEAFGGLGKMHRPA